MSEFLKTNKVFRFTVDICKADGTADSKDFYVEGYAATSDLDRQGDIILAEALSQAAKDLVTINNTVFYGHEYDLSNAVGRIVDANVDATGLKVKIYVSQMAQELRVKLQERIINKFSIGGRVVKDKLISREEAISEGLISGDSPFDRIKLIEKLELFEVSFVGVPANPNAQVVDTFVKALTELYKGGGDKMEDVNKKEEIKPEEVKKEEPKKEEEVKAEEVKKEDEKIEGITEEEFKAMPPEVATCIREKIKGGMKPADAMKECWKEYHDSHPAKENELSEEEIKDLVEAEKAAKPKPYKPYYKPYYPAKPGAKPAANAKPYYYYYNDKKVLDLVTNVDKKLDAVVAGIDALRKLIEEKVKTIEVHSEKKSVIKTEDDPDVKKTAEKPIVTDDLMDSYFQHKITGKLVE